VNDLVLLGDSEAVYGDRAIMQGPTTTRTKLLHINVYKEGAPETRVSVWVSRRNSLVEIYVNDQAASNLRRRFDTCLALPNEYSGKNSRCCVVAQLLWHEGNP
jgi:hypothetical protein